MEGSPVRGPEKSAIVRLNETADLQSFQAEVIRIVAADVRHAEILFSVFDDESNSLSLPSWIQSYVERHSALQTKLEQGELVGISYAEGTRVPRPVGAARSSVVLIPVISDSVLQAVIGLVSQLDDPQPAAEDIERVRQLAYDAGPIVCRLREGAKLRRENEQL